MTLVTQTYTRKPIHFEAVRVTKYNMAEVSAWCGGLLIRENEGSKHTWFIKVDVKRPLNVRQTKAFVGDWVLCLNGSFRVYTNQAFNKSFVATNEESMPLESNDESELVEDKSNTSKVNPASVARRIKRAAEGFKSDLAEFNRLNEEFQNKIDASKLQVEIDRKLIDEDTILYVTPRQ